VASGRDLRFRSGDFPSSAVSFQVNQVTISANIASQSSTSADDDKAATFARILFARLSADSAQRIAAGRRDSLAAEAFDFLAERREPVQVRVMPAAGGAPAFVETIMDDCPFIIDSLLEYLHHERVRVGLLLHPVIHAARDHAGRLVSFENVRASEHPESFVHIEIELDPSLHSLAALEAGIRSVLEEVRSATGDFEAMTSRALEICDETAGARDQVELRDLLRWLVGGGFIFLGYRRYSVSKQEGKARIAAVPEPGLGILRDFSRSRYATPVDVAALAPALQRLLFEGAALIIGKTHAFSHVHRRRRMDDVTIRRFGPDGSVDAFDRFVGMFTSKAHAEEAQRIPMLRAKLRAVLEAEKAEPGSHDYKELVTAFNSFPKEELFRAPVSEMREQLRLILELKNEAAMRLSVNYDPVRNSVATLVIIPRENFSAEVRKQIQDAIGRILKGESIYYYLALGEGYSAQLHFCHGADSPTAAQVREMEREIEQIARRWDDRLRDELIRRLGAERAQALASRWLAAFDEPYRASTSVGRAASDIARIERLREQGQSFGVELATAESPEADARAARELRMFELGEPLRLSEIMPMLQNCGITVISEEAHELRPGPAGVASRAFVQSFCVEGPAGEPLTAMPGAALIADALAAVRQGMAEDDALNGLVLRAALDWHEAALLRAYLSAAFQMHLAPARLALTRVAVNHPKLARTLVDLFKARMDPAAETPAARLAELRATYLDALGAVDNIADDRTARALLSLVEATVRTNYFVTRPAPWIALKFESARIANLPGPTPLYEIHVDNPRMAGCHLRAGRIARGGIRYSDRLDDFRTEILDLMKTQTAKNAIIVPVGAKGGFVLKPRPGRAAAPEDVVEAYTTLIRAMLELTDHVVADRVMHPNRVRVLDTDGPYLVVAADNGTAAFSDLANEIAQQHGFWLGDAFASGGRHGYDHKAMGITARGAWESALWHLREMGIELDHGAPITLVGIGDMSGDVFGNALMLSNNVKLIAAFNHRHIFIDPDPDPAASFAERKRLFAKAGSQWSDYKPALISRGGGIYRRGQKTVALAPEAWKALGCEPQPIDSESLVQAILRANVTMLYNGGIGTYVRASAETDADVGDHANDACRIAAAGLRAKIVVEGGNLGLTQRARVEYAMAGGRINTDAIDNSAGVDTSDHEVNLKILLQPAVARGAISMEDRNRVLAAAESEVAALVLSHNRDQVVSLSLEQVRGRDDLSAFRDHISALEQRGMMRRAEESLPTHEELHERRARFAGLTRPELAVLTAYTKIDVVAQLESSRLADDPYLAGRFLEPYFPVSIARGFPSEIPNHGLRRELIATTIGNAMVDLMGSTFVFTLSRSHGAEPLDVIRAWLFAEGALDLFEQAQRLRAGAGEQGAQAELAALLACERAARRACRWALENLPSDASLGATIERFKPPLTRLGAEFEAMLADGERDRFERSYRELRSAVYTEQVAHQLARLSFADHLLNILNLSFSSGAALHQVARVYFGLSRIIEFAPLQDALERIGSEDRWEHRAAEGLASELDQARLTLSAALLDYSDDPDGAIGRLRQGRERVFDAAASVMGELRTMQSVGLPALQVAIRSVSRLARSVSDSPPAGSSQAGLISSVSHTTGSQ